MLIVKFAILRKVYLPSKDGYFYSICYVFGVVSFPRNALVSFARNGWSACAGMWWSSSTESPAKIQQDLQQVNTLQQQNNYTKQVQTAQTVQAVAGFATELLDVWAQSRQQKAEEQARQEQIADQQREQEQARQEQIREEQEQMREKNIEITNNILGTHINEKFIDLPRSNSSISNVYYIAWYRAFNDNTVYIFPAIVIKKYSDGTWPFFNDIKAKMRSKMSDAGAANNAVPLLIGYYQNEADMQSAANDLINNANSQQLMVKKLYIEEKKDISDQSSEEKAKSSKSFWDK
jgi:hypothetical protein